MGLSKPQDSVRDVLVQPACEEGSRVRVVPTPRPGGDRRSQAQELLRGNGGSRLTPVYLVSVGSRDLRLLADEAQRIWLGTSFIQEDLVLPLVRHPSSTAR